MEQGLRAAKELDDHHVYVKQERAYALATKQRALDHPEQLLWIAQDATDQLAYGLPIS